MSDSSSCISFSSSPSWIRNSGDDNASSSVKSMNVGDVVDDSFQISNSSGPAIKDVDLSALANVDDYMHTEVSFCSLEPPSPLRQVRIQLDDGSSRSNDVTSWVQHLGVVLRDTAYPCQEESSPFNHPRDSNPRENLPSATTDASCHPTRHFEDAAPPVQVPELPPERAPCHGENSVSSVHVPMLPLEISTSPIQTPRDAEVEAPEGPTCHFEDAASPIQVLELSTSPIETPRDPEVEAREGPTCHFEDAASPIQVLELSTSPIQKPRDPEVEAPEGPTCHFEDAASPVRVPELVPLETPKDITYSSGQLEDIALLPGDGDFTPDDLPSPLDDNGPSQNGDATCQVDVSNHHVEETKHAVAAPWNGYSVKDRTQCAEFEVPPSIQFKSLKLVTHLETCLRCSYCSRTLYAECQDSVALDPCGCILCPECAFVTVMNRKFTDFSCPCCDEIVDSVIYKRGMEGTQEKIQPKKHCTNRNKDPCRFFMDNWNDNPVGMEDKVILSVTSIDAATHAPRSVSAMIDLEEGPETEMDEFVLVNIFTLLHRPVFSLVSRLDNIPATQSTMGEVIEYAAFYDESLILRLLYALGTGEARVHGLQDWRNVEPENDRRWKDGYLSRLSAIFIAKEMMVRVTSQGPGMFQFAMSHMLEHTNANKATKELFSRIRLAASPTCLERANWRSFEAAMRLTSRIPNALDHCCGSLDNIGFKRRFEYLNWTLVQSFLNRCEKLKSLGFYRSDNALSRDGVDFETFKALKGSNEETARAIVAVQTRDFEALSEYVMTHLHYVRNCPLPSYEACCDMIESNNFTNGFTFRPNLGLRLKAQTSLAYLRDNVSTCDTVFGRVSLPRLGWSLAITGFLVYHERCGRTDLCRCFRVWVLLR
jgi:hypothetical protein